MYALIEQVQGVKIHWGARAHLPDENDEWEGGGGEE